MAIPSKQIGQSTESNLLWNISKQIEWFTKVAASSFSNLSGTFVPYIGATSNVNLGGYSIAAYAFINPNGGSNSFLKADGSLDNTQYIDVLELENYAVPYNGANADINLGANKITVGDGSILNTPIFKVNGLSDFKGTISSDIATLSDNLATVGTGAGWTGTDFTSGYTHVSGAQDLNTTIGASTGEYYTINWTITNRTTGSVTIRFGSFTRNLITSSGNYTFLNSNNTNFLFIGLEGLSNFNGIIQISIYKITPALSTINLRTSDNVIATEIRTCTVKDSNSTPNIFIGYQAGLLNYLGSANAFLGNYAGFLNTIGSGNTYIGVYAGQSVSSGNGNTALGASSLAGNFTGSQNTSIGTGTQTLTIADSNCVLLGYLTRGLGDNTTVIGNNQTLLAAIYGNLLLGGTTNHNAKLDVTGNSLQNGNRFFLQPVPTAKTVTGTLTIVDLLTSIITVTSSTAVSFTLPMGTLTDAGILGGLLPINNAFDWTIINKGSLLGITTILAGATHTIVGLATIAINSQGTFRTTKTSANTFVSYRVS